MKNTDNTKVAAKNAGAEKSAEKPAVKKQGRAGVKKSDNGVSINSRNVSAEFRREDGWVRAKISVSEELLIAVAERVARLGSEKLAVRR